MPGTGLRVLTPVGDCIKQTPSRLACMEHLVPIFTSGNSDLLIPASLALYRPSLHTSLKQLSHSIPSESDLNSSPWSLWTLRDILSRGTDSLEPQPAPCCPLVGLPGTHGPTKSLGTGAHLGRQVQEICVPTTYWLSLDPVAQGWDLCDPESEPEMSQKPLPSESQCCKGGRWYWGVCVCECVCLCLCVCVSVCVLGWGGSFRWNTFNRILSFFYCVVVFKSCIVLLYCSVA